MNMMRAKLWPLAFIVLANLVLSVPLWAQRAQQNRPSQAPAHYLKAAWMVNFIKFVRWPEHVEAGDSLTLAIYGDLELSRMFDLLDEQVIRGKQIRVRYIKEIPAADDLEDVHVLYVSQRKRRVIPHILNLTEDKPVLTISDMSQFVDEGGIMAFQSEDHLMLFDINQAEALNSKLFISSKILGRARRVIRAKSQ